MLHGFFHNKCPRTKIVLVGESGEEKIDALVDTGFNGFLSVPEVIAKSIGLEFTQAIESSTIADGSSSPSLIYRGKVVYDGSRVDILIDVQPNCKILLGTALLEELQLSLFVDVAMSRIEFNPSGRVARPT